MVLASGVATGLPGVKQGHDIGGHSRSGYHPIPRTESDGIVTRYRIGERDDEDEVAAELPL